jgi:hypothetical protein
VKKFLGWAYERLEVFFFERNIHPGRPPLWILLKRKGRQHCTKETQQEKRSYTGSKPWGGRRTRLEDLYRKSDINSGERSLTLNSDPENKSWHKLG